MPNTSRNQWPYPDWNANWQEWQGVFFDMVSAQDATVFSITEGMSNIFQSLPNASIVYTGGEYRLSMTSDLVLISRTYNVRISVVNDDYLVLRPNAMVCARVTPGAVGAQNTAFELVDFAEIDPGLRVFGYVTEAHGINWWNGSVLLPAEDARQIFSFLGEGGGGTDDKRVKVSVGDTTAAFLSEKIIAGDGSVTISVVDEGANEKLSIVSVGSGSSVATLAEYAVGYGDADDELTGDAVNFHWTSNRQLHVGAGTPNRIGTTSDSLYVTGRAEVDGIADFDSDIYVRGNAYLFDDKAIYFGNSTDAILGYSATSQTTDTLLLGLPATSNNLIVTTAAGYTTNWNKSIRTNPTLFIMSANTSTSMYIAASHDQSNALIESGYGSLGVKDTYIAGSTYGAAYMPWAVSAAEWTAITAIGGTGVSLLGLIAAVKSSGFQYIKRDNGTQWNDYGILYQGAGISLADGAHGISIANGGVITIAKDSPIGGAIVLAGSVVQGGTGNRTFTFENTVTTAHVGANTPVSGNLIFTGSVIQDGNTFNFTGDGEGTTYSNGVGLALNGTQFSLSYLGIQNLTDPGGDRIMFWDESFGTGGAVNWFNIGGALSITGTTLSSPIYTSGSFSHHGLTDLTTYDDHTQYLLVNGTRALGGDWSLGGNDIGGAGWIAAVTNDGATPFDLGDTLDTWMFNGVDNYSGHPGYLYSGFYTEDITEGVLAYMDISTYGEARIGVSLNGTTEYAFLNVGIGFIEFCDHAFHSSTLWDATDKIRLTSEGVDGVAEVDALYNLGTPGEKSLIAGILAARGTLQDAYNCGGAGAGRIVNVLSGPITFNNANRPSEEFSDYPVLSLAQSYAGAVDPWFTISNASTSGAPAITLSGAAGTTDFFGHQVITTGNISILSGADGDLLSFFNANQDVADETAITVARVRAQNSSSSEYAYAYATASADWASLYLKSTGQLSLNSDDDIHLDADDDIFVTPTSDLVINPGGFTTFSLSQVRDVLNLTHGDETDSLTWSTSVPSAHFDTGTQTQRCLLSTNATKIVLTPPVGCGVFCLKIIASGADRTFTNFVDATTNTQYIGWLAGDGNPDTDTITIPSGTFADVSIRYEDVSGTLVATGIVVLQ